MSFFGVPLRNGLPIGLGSGAGFGVPAFNPQQLFSNGEQGAWYDPSDFSTMFQDIAGTTPVTAVGQSVALIRDKSGRGNDATQSVASSMPTVNVDASGKYFLLFDGSNDGMVTGNINFSATDKMTVWAGARKLTDGTAFQVIAELTADVNTINGAFTVGAATALGDASRRNWAAGLRGTTFLLGSANIYAAPDTKVMTVQYDIAGAAAANEVAVRLNAVSQSLTYGTPDAGTGNFTTAPLYLGRRGGTTTPFNGRLYSLIVRGAASTAVEVSNTEYWVADRTGVSL